MNTKTISIKELNLREKTEIRDLKERLKLESRYGGMPQLYHELLMIGCRALAAELKAKK